MNAIGQGLTGYLVLLAMALLVHEPWRWLGWIIGRRVDPEGDVFQWVRAVSTALLCALCARLVVFPAGALESVPFAVRLGALAIGLGVYSVGPRRPLPGILAGTGAIVIGKLALG